MKCEHSAIAYNCPCHAVDCNRYAKCCECVSYHNGKDQFPACFFSEQAESQGRDLELLIKDRKALGKLV